jgi:hypothetical protein
MIANKYLLTKLSNIFINYFLMILIIPMLLMAYLFKKRIYKIGLKLLVLLILSTWKYNKINKLKDQEKKHNQMLLHK